MEKDTEMLEMGIYFKDPAAFAMEGMVFLHDYIMCICIVIFTIVVWFTFVIIWSFGIRLSLIENMEVTDPRVRLRLRPYGNNRHKLLEIIWTILPLFILAAIATPSFALLYAIEKARPYEVLVKVSGNQWYWSYTIAFNLEEEEISIFTFDSYIVPEEELKFGQLRLLEVDNPLVLPAGVGVKFIVTGEDVIHSFSVMELGIKMDAVPGRANKVWTYMKRTGVFRGQCSELRGVNHGFMPIVVYSVPYFDFCEWFAKKSS